jgi:asparagine synthase (glutamine-hydrolysing)
MAGYLLSSQGDRMLMANSVEGRFPYLDHRVIEFARRVPPQVLMKGLNEKHLLKQAMSRDLPVEIVRRAKQPYRAPGIPAFFDNGWQEDVRDLLSVSVLQKYGYFDADRVRRLMQKIESGRALGEKDNMAFIAVLSTQLLHREFIEGTEHHYEGLRAHATADTPVHTH